MTIDRAIEILNPNTPCSLSDISEFDEALKMAVKALRLIENADMREVQDAADHG